MERPTQFRSKMGALVWLLNIFSPPSIDQADESLFLLEEEELAELADELLISEALPREVQRAEFIETLDEHLGVKLPFDIDPYAYTLHAFAETYIPDSLVRT